jgi:phenylacetate-CoA ligase
MNQLLNPLFISKVLKSYFFDINRLWTITDEELKRFKDKQFRKIVDFAYTVPLYHELYKKAGIYPDDIRGIKDIVKLPFVSKDELEKYYPDGLVSSRIDKDKLIEVSTSGTTGRSLSVFVDLYDIVIGLFGYIRMLREYDINWRKDRLTIIGDFAPHTVESGYINKGIFSKMQNSVLLKNMQWLDTNDKPEEIIEKINSFKPDFLGGYVGMIGHLALLKEKGRGRDINPRVIGTTGSVFDDSLRKFIGNIFNAELFETYGSTEAGSIAFQCKKGGYHIQSDFVHLEIIENGKYVSSGEPGHVTVTKLYGIGTPIIRYTAMNDIAAPLKKSCNCGMSGDILKKVYGRDILSLYLPNGKVLLPASITQIFSKILYELKTNKVIDLQVIQHNFQNLEVKLVIDKHLRNKGPSLKEISSLIKLGFQEKIGSDINISVKEVEKISRKDKRIISKMDKEEIKITGYV